LYLTETKKTTEAEMTTTETATQTLTVTELFTFLEDKQTPQELKDTLEPVLFEHADNADEFWVVSRDGDTFTAREADERDY
jgi:hypothetical protein